MRTAISFELLKRKKDQHISINGSGKLFTLLDLKQIVQL